MVRARTNRVVMSQRDVRQTTQPEPAQAHAHAHAQPAAVSHNNVRGSSKTYCTWCRANGREYACLAESSHASCVDAECFMPTQDWTSSAMNSEGWVPTSGPCCEDCLEAAFDPLGGRKGEAGTGVGREMMEEVNGWCRARGEQVRHSARKGWQVLCGWLERAKQRWRPPRTEDVKVGGWEEVRYEAEGFLEVKVVLSRAGVIQHMEVDLPTQVAIHYLKAELTTLIDIPAGQQQWFYQAQLMDDTKSLEELNVDIGAIIEVKCQT